MDVDFKFDNDSIFTSRAVALIFNKDRSKILLLKIDDRDYYMLPGGRIKFFEGSDLAVKREVKEELGFDLDFKFVSIQENLIVDKKRIMQYCFCYSAIYDGEISSEHIKNLDSSNEYFIWVDVNDVDNYKILPIANYDLIKNNFDNIKHTIED